MMLLRLNIEVMMMLLRLNIEVMMLLKLNVEIMMMLLKLSSTKLRMESTWTRHEEDIVKYAVRQLEAESS